MSEKDPASVLPPQQLVDRKDAKPDYRPLRAARRCYEIVEAEGTDGSNVRLFWLESSGKRTRIPPWPSFFALTTVTDTITYLRQRGYITLEEAANKE